MHRLFVVIVSFVFAFSADAHEMSQWVGLSEKAYIGTLVSIDENEGDRTQGTLSIRVDRVWSANALRDHDEESSVVLKFVSTLSGIPLAEEGAYVIAFTETVRGKEYLLSDRANALMEISPKFRLRELTYQLKEQRAASTDLSRCGSDDSPSIRYLIDRIKKGVLPQEDFLRVALSIAEEEVPTLVRVLLSRGDEKIQANLTLPSAAVHEKSAGLRLSRLSDLVHHMLRTRFPGTPAPDIIATREHLRKAGIVWSTLALKIERAQGRCLKREKM